MLKILQARLQQYMNRERPDVYAGFRKGREGERSQDGGGVGRGEFIKKAFKRQVNSTKQLLNAGRGHQAPRKASISALLSMPKPLTVWITINCGKF